MKRRKRKIMLRKMLIALALLIASPFIAFAVLLAVASLLLSMPAQGTELVHQFKNPSFSGVNASAHWLTIENQETSRKKAIQDKIEAQLKAEAQAEQNSILNKFMTNLQSRIYSQLAKQLTDNLFGPESQQTGSFELDGNTISFDNGDDGIALRIIDADGNVTEIVIPNGSFKF
jgi:predicted PurR-regulated permease PerM